MNIGELKIFIADLPDHVELAQYGHSGNMLFAAQEPELFTVTKEFAALNPGRNWCDYVVGTTVLVVAEQDG